MMSSFEDLKTVAQEFVGQLLRADFTSAALKFDDQMKTVLGEVKLQETWQNLISEAGTFLQMEVERTTEMEGYRVVVIRCQLQRAVIDVQLVFNDREEISGLNFIPTQMEYHPPAYADQKAFHEVEITVGQGKWALPGALTLPNGSSPFPGVVLVHGSGPNDRDETIGPNKTFRDLAWGLASQGVAVLRYDKRTFKHAESLTPDLVDKMTVKEEVMDDALLALQLLRQRDEIDPKRVFLLGHSLGATLAPSMGQQDPELAGLIIMAGITRPLEDTILDQYTYLYSLAGEITQEQQAELEDLKKKVDRLKDPEISDKVSAQDLPLGVPITYWLDLRRNNPLDAVKNITMPILVLQGGRDYQVLKTKDFETWKEALKNRENASFKLFSKLNHLFIAGEGLSNPQEYLVEGHVEEEVIDTIVQWINGI